MDMYTEHWLRTERELLDEAGAGATAHGRRASHPTSRPTPRTVRGTTIAVIGIALTVAFAGCSDDGATGNEAVAAPVSTSDDHVHRPRRSPPAPSR